MLPAHDPMASPRIMPVRFEIPAVDFQFKQHQLPLSRRDLSFGLAIRKRRLQPVGILWFSGISLRALLRWSFLVLRLRCARAAGAGNNASARSLAALKRAALPPSATHFFP